MGTAAPFRPLVSVIVPTFNAQTTLDQALQSAISGTYGNIEIIVVDDGSTDSSVSIAQTAAGRDPRIRILRRDNGGPSAALNSGLNIATGQYVARLDSDDLWHPRKLEAQVALAQQYSDVAFVYSFIRYLDGEGRVLSDGPAQIFPPRALCRGIYESIVGVGSSALIKRAAITEAGGYDEAFRGWEDLLLQLKVSAGHPIGIVPEYLVGYRVRPGSLSNDIDAMVESWWAMRARLRTDFPKVPRFVHAWAHGTRCANFAEGYAWKARYFRSATLLIEAMRHDPAWTLEYLRFRLARRAAKRCLPVKETAPAKYFFDCDPAQPVAADWFEQYPAHARFTRFEAQRGRVLAEVDERLAPGRLARLDAA